MSNLTYSSIRKTFGDNVALHSFDLNVQQSELISLLGPSGCGKTTALRIAAGFEFADSGSIVVGGTDISNKPAHKRNMGWCSRATACSPTSTSLPTSNTGYAPA